MTVLRYLTSSSGTSISSAPTPSVPSVPLPTTTLLNHEMNPIIKGALQVFVLPDGVFVLGLLPVALVGLLWSIDCNYQRQRKDKAQAKARMDAWKQSNIDNGLVSSDFRDGPTVGWTDTPVYGNDLREKVRSWEEVERDANNPTAKEGLQSWRNRGYGYNIFSS